MVRLFPVQPSGDTMALSESIEEGDGGLDGSPSAATFHGLTALQLALNPSATIYHGYDTYIEDGLLCLRHKIRNMEKKKVASALSCASKCLCINVSLLLNSHSGVQLKLEGYQTRLKNGETLNQDQMVIYRLY